VIDGFSDEPIRDTAVLVEDGRIAALAPTFGKLPPDTVTIDLSGRWLLPGLIDAHVHLNDLRAARDLVHTGVTTIRTMGVRHHIDIGSPTLYVTYGNCFSPATLYAINSVMGAATSVGTTGIDGFGDSW
jgi:N-acetylglucosamine-6-phosphate deacetylase